MSNNSESDSSIRNRYLRYAQQENYAFLRYREYGENPVWSQREIDRQFPNFSVRPIPAAQPPTIRFGGPGRNFGLNAFERPHRGPADIAGSTLPSTAAQDARAAQDRYREIRGYFLRASPHLLRLQKPLGWGGHGIATHFKYYGRILTDPHGRRIPDRYGQDIVMKFPMEESWDDEEFLKEAKTTRKVKKSAHCVQAIDRQDILLRPAPEFPLELSGDDSSVDGNSSGDESTGPIRVGELRRALFFKRRNRTENQQRTKYRRKLRRIFQIFEEREAAMHQIRNRRDYIILEYLENGDIAHLIYKLVESEGQIGVGQRFDKPVPNRVLWAFWLCLVRSCVAMEYPPRKIHPNRRAPSPPGPLSIPLAAAEASERREGLEELGVHLYDGEDFAARTRRHVQQADDLIEEVPQGIKAVRRQNLVHFDIDPRNIFIGGLELTFNELRHWYDARMRAESDRTEWDRVKDVEFTGKRPDRHLNEHSLVPRLKLGDFGLAEIIKREKSNLYYLSRRYKAKAGFYAPEQFAVDWEQFPDSEDGHETAESLMAGYFGPWTNVWGIAMTMWCLITRLHPPRAPRPQVPRDVYENHPELPENPSEADLLPIQNELQGQPISYCPRIYNPRVHEYDWADETLRRTIYECMYHTPGDRPTLATLLDQAKENLGRAWPNETDDHIRDWVYTFIYGDGIPPPLSDTSSDSPADTGSSDPYNDSSGNDSSGNDSPGNDGSGNDGPGNAGPSNDGPGNAGPSNAGPGNAGPSITGPSITGPSNAGPSNAGPGNDGPKDAGPKDAGSKATDSPIVYGRIGQGDVDNFYGPPGPLRDQRLAAGGDLILDATDLLNFMFPHGWDAIQNFVPRSQCGLRSVYDSLVARFGNRMTSPGGAVVDVPSATDLIRVYHNMIATGLITVTGPMPGPTDGPEEDLVIHTVLNTWAANVGLDLVLGIIPTGHAAGPPRLLTSFPAPTAHVVWIHHTGTYHWVGVMARGPAGGGIYKSYQSTSGFGWVV